VGFLHFCFQINIYVVCRWLNPFSFFPFRRYCSSSSHIEKTQTDPKTLTKPHLSHLCETIKKVNKTFYIKGKKIIKELFKKALGQDQGQGQGEVDGDFHQLPAAYC
jgi:hypothetical protein